MDEFNALKQDPPPADFFLSSEPDSSVISGVRSCWMTDRFRDSVGDRFVLVRIRPSLWIQEQEFRSTKLDNLVLSPRFSVGQIAPSLDPVAVNVYQISDPDLYQTRLVTSANLKVIAWATVYFDYALAERALTLSQ